MTVKRHLLASSALSDVLFDEPDVGRCLVAPDGSVIRANAEWLRSTGFSLDDVLGADIIGLFPETRGLALALHARVRAGHRVEVPRRAQRIDGRETWWEGSIAPIPMEGGTGLLITAREASGRAVPPDPGHAVGQQQEGERLWTEAREAAEGAEAVLSHAGAMAQLGAWWIEISNEDDLNLNPLRWSDEVFRIFGYEPGEVHVTNDLFFQHVHPDDRKLVVDAVSRSIASGERYSVEHRVIRRDGAERTVLERGEARRDGSGRLLRIVGAVQDITERKRAEEAMRVSEETARHRSAELQALLDAVPAAVFITRDRDARHMEANRYCAEMLRVPATSNVSKSAEGSAAPRNFRAMKDGREIPPPALPVQIAAARGEEVRDYEFDLVFEDGEVRHVFGNAKPLTAPDGSPSGAVGAFLDITERKRAEEDLREAVGRYERQARLFEGVASTTPDFVYVFDLQGRFLYANQRLLEVWGMQLSEVIGKNPRELGYEQWHHDMHMREIAQVIETKQPIKGEVPFKAPLTGIFGIYEYIFTPVIGADGEVETIAGTTRDVTHRKRAEEGLREKQQSLEQERARLQAVIDTIPVGFFLVEPGGKVVVTNDEAKRMWRGAARLEQIADYDRYVGYWPGTGERLKPEEWPAAQALLHGRRTKGVMVDIERFDGTRGTILVSSAPIQDVAGNVTGAVVATQDISELRATQARLEEVDRRKTEFLAMLSHELRNPLAPIRNSIYLLERTAPESEQATRAREVVRRQTEHLTRLVDDLLDVTRISHGKIPLERSRADLREIVRKTTDDLHSVFMQAGIDLRIDYVTAGPMWVDADPTRISQVLTNLLNNSAKFTPSGGTVRVGVAARAGCAELSVSDDGIGMDPRHVERMFEPFAQADSSLARTKGGLGLGLALVKSIVELHGGTVSARSEGPGRGAEFLIRLPLVAAETQSERKRPPDAATTSRTILVIEDNVDGAQSLAQILELHGHRVRVARDGRSGIALARELHPDVVLCDIGLPDVDGYEVARTLRRDGALRGTRLVAVSGYAQLEDRRRARDAGFDAHLAKPMDLDELMTVLNEGR